MVQEQSAIAEEQPMVGAEQAQPVAVSDAGAVADAVASAVADFDLSTPAGIKAAAEKYPALKNWREEGYGAGLEAGKQRTLAEMQRDQASAERVHATTKQILERYGIDLDPEDEKTLTGLTRANYEAVRLETMRNLALEAKSMTATETEAALLQDLIDKADGNADAMQEVASRAMSAVASQAQREGKESLTLDELLTNEKHRKALEDWYVQRQMEEQRAQDVESSRIELPPGAPSGSLGSPGGMTIDRWLGMTPDARKEYAVSQDDAGRQALWEMVGANLGR
jgi:hypothetical protein